MNTYLWIAIIVVVSVSNTTMQSKIRDAIVSDAAQIAEVQYVSWIHTYSGLVPVELLNLITISDNLTIWESEIRNKTSKVLVTEISNRIVGFLSMKPTHHNEASPKSIDLTALYLRPEIVRNGVGKRLVKASIKRAKIDFSRIHLQVLSNNTNAIDFYTYMGFGSSGKKGSMIFYGQKLITKQMYLDI